MASAPASPPARIDAGVSCTVSRGVGEENARLMSGPVNWLLRQERSPSLFIVARNSNQKLRDKTGNGKKRNMGGSHTVSSII